MCYPAYEVHYNTLLFLYKLNYWSVDGTKLKEQSPPLTLEDLKVIGLILFKQNNLKYAKDRTLLNSQWVSIGRASEIGGITFDDIHWMDGFLLGDITRRKVVPYFIIICF